MKHRRTFSLLPDPLMVRNARIESRGKNFWIEGLVFWLIFIIASVVQSVLIFVPEFIGLMQTPTFQQIMEQARNGTLDFSNYFDQVQQMVAELPGWVMTAMLFSTVGIILVVLVYCKKFEKRKFSTLGLTRTHCVSEYLIGLGIGLLMFVLVIGLNLLTGGVRFGGVIFRLEMLPVLIVTLLGYVVQGASEEILCRGYCCISYARRMPLWVGLLMNSIFFSLLHLGNSGISPLALCNLFLFGVFMTVYMVRRGNLWGACAIHTIWNFVQGSVFGLEVSGTSAGSSVLRMESVESGSLWNGGAFGPEGGLCVTIVLAAAILSVLLFCKNRDLGQTPDPVPAEVSAAIEG